MATVYVGIGSNLGDRAESLNRAVELLRQTSGIDVTRVSTIRETEPVGGPAGQGKYLNAVAELRTEMEPQALLGILLDVEARLGRVRQERHGPRTLDLDLLLYEEQIIDDPALTVPHPRMHERLFVLEPLAEIAPLAVHPRLQSTVHDLLRAMRGTDARELLGLRAMVTGSSSGIGRAIALELAQAGADVLIHCRQSQERAAAVCKEVVRLGRRSSVIQADLCEGPACERLLDESWKQWGGLDIWINNAGADTLTGDAAHWPFERKLAELWAVDVRGTMLLSRAVGRRMREQGRGVIVNMGWDQAETGMAGDSGELFAAAKGAVMAFSKSLAKSLAPQVRVLCLAPGWIRTAWGENASAAWQQRVLRETPLGRWGTPEDVARTVRWLVGPGSSFITGQIVRINGGAV